MTPYIAIVPPSGPITFQDVESPELLDALQSAVGGNIEIVRYLDKIEFEGRPESRCVAFCNDEGKIDGLPFNERASGFWIKLLVERGMLQVGPDSRVKVRDVLVGPIAFVCGDDAFLARL